MGNKWFAGRWPCMATGKINIATLELYPIYLALRLWAVNARDTAVHIHTDNEALVPVLNKLYAKDPSLQAILRVIASLCLANNLLIKCFHVSGKDNLRADMLSRDAIHSLLAAYPAFAEGRAEIPSELLPDRCGLLHF
jgi:hypothetical protein